MRDRNPPNLSWVLAAIIAALANGVYSGIHTGEHGIELFGFALAFLLIPGFLAVITLAWSERTWRYIPHMMLAITALIVIGNVAAERQEARTVGPRAVEGRSGATSLGPKLGHTLVEDDAAAGAPGKNTVFTIDGNVAYVSSEHASVDSVFRIASIYPARGEGTGPSFMVVNMRRDARPIDAREIERLLQHQGGVWEGGDSLVWWRGGRSSASANLAQCTADRIKCTFTQAGEAVTFLSQSYEAREIAQ